MEKIRIQKMIADSGYCSRRKAEELISYKGGSVEEELNKVSEAINEELAAEAAEKAAAEAAKKTIEKCERIETTSLASALKNPKTQACRSLAAAFDEVLKELKEFAYKASTVQYLFEKADDEEPYCFMKVLDGLNRFRSNYSFSADAYGYDPVKYGTKFAEMYQAMAKVIGEHCKDFVEKHGHSNL